MRATPRVASRSAVGACATALVVLAVAGCGSSSSNSSSSTSTASSSSSTTASTSSSGTYTLTAGVLHAFTGQNAFFGQTASTACKAAAQQINGAGGILGHKLSCSNYDTKGDPADAVPVANRMLLAKHLSMVVGPDGNDIPAVLPLVQQAKVPEMNTVGDPRYDKQTNEYFWRLTPSDSSQSPALAYYTANQGLKKAVSVFTSDLSAQTTIGPFESKYNSLGGSLIKKLSISPDQSSYQTEVSQVVSAKPQAVVGEMDPRTAATFLSQLQQQAGKLPPLVLTQRTTQPDWEPAVGKAIGVANMTKSVTAVAPVQPESGKAIDAFSSAITATGGDAGDAHNPFVAALYDGVVTFALAMNVANSVDSNTYVNHIAEVTSAKPGATVVATYADAVKAIKAGKKIQYVGPSGKMPFDQYHTAQRPYAVWKYDPAKKGWRAGTVLPSTANTASG